MRDDKDTRRDQQESGTASEGMSAEERERRFKESLARVKKNHADALKRLADR